jgi:hypothetical protein
MNAKKINSIKKIYIGILLVIFGGIVLHAPLIVGFGTLWPKYALIIKSWKEILMLVAGVIAIFLLYKNKQMKLLRDPIIIAIGIYVALHLILVFLLPQTLKSSVAGLMIDLRYVLFFGLVYIAMRLYPEYQKIFIKVGVAGALIVLIFAILQVFVLPYDVLKYIGYNKNTIIPYLVIDQNYSFIRINSTLRGPNPLGAYACIILVLIASIVSKRKIVKEKWPLIITSILAIGGVVALWASYSRSALVGTFIAVALVLVVTTYRKLSLKIWIIISSILILSMGILYMVSGASFMSNILLHDDPNSSHVTESNKEHIKSLKTGFSELLHQPLGDGVGSTGSASLYGNHPITIENQYLFTAHETGWLGLALFGYIFVAILMKLWGLRKNWLALGVFASGIGLALVGLLLPVWVDDTVAIIWWGLAAIALLPNLQET